jgi:hypothetical protein
MTRNWRGLVAAAIIIGLVAYAACGRDARARPGHEGVATGLGSPIVATGRLPAPAQAVTPTATITATVGVVTPVPPATSTPGPGFVFAFIAPPDGCVASIIHAPGWLVPEPGKPLDSYPWEQYGWQNVVAGRQFAEGAIYYIDVGCPQPIEPTETDEPTPTTAPTVAPTQTPWIVVVTATPAPTREPAQVPLQIMQSDGVIIDGLRARILPDGTLAPWEPWVYLGIEGGGEVKTVADEGYYHILSCGFPAPTPEPEPRVIHLPWAGRRR